MNTTEILQKTEKLVNDSRAKTHGDKIKNHENIARLVEFIFTEQDTIKYCSFARRCCTAYDFVKDSKVTSR